MSEPGFGSEPLAGFLEALASSASTPGGGSAAAVAGAAGAALVAMVGRLTDGKQGYEASWERMREIVAAADEARAAFLSLADRDTAAFDAVMDAFRMPKDDDEDRVTRSEAIQRATFQFHVPVAPTNRASAYARDRQCPMCDPNTTACSIWARRYEQLGPHRP